MSDAWGDHDLAENIVHLVLARSPGSPPGTAGISLFLVPKLLSDGTRNAVTCTTLEDKLGIHGSPTCAMQYSGAIGELVGVECGGMRAMFTMMNAARLAIAVQGLATGERSYQQALAYAHERRQGRAPGALPGEASPIVNHPDVRRMLLELRASTRAMRLLLYATSAAGDRSEHADDSATRAAARRRVDLLTPIAKAWCTDTGFRMASLGMQVHGGVGYVEDVGVAQRLRDSRIAMIYEGTNGIHGVDLVTRKLLRDEGRGMRELLADIYDAVSALSSYPELAEALDEAANELQATTEWILVRAADDVDVLGGATQFLELTGDVIAAWLTIRQAVNAALVGDPSADELLGDARFFSTAILPRAAARRRTITAGASHPSTVPRVESVLG